MMIGKDEPVPSNDRKNVFPKEPIRRRLVVQAVQEFPVSQRKVWHIEEAT